MFSWSRSWRLDYKIQNRWLLPCFPVQETEDLITRFKIVDFFQEIEDLTTKFEIVNCCLAFLFKKLKIWRRFDYFLVFLFQQLTTGLENSKIIGCFHVLLLLCFPIQKIEDLITNFKFVNYFLVFLALKIWFTCVFLEIKRERSHVLFLCVHFRYVWMKLINNAFISEIKQNVGK